MTRAVPAAERQALLVIAAFVAIRLIASAFTGLGVDEAYTASISRDLHLSYFDHPPLHQWIAHAGETAFGFGRWARLPFIALFAGSSWLMFRLTARLFGQTAGLWAVLALNLSAFFTIAAGEWILPDGPLAFCELAAALCLARQVFPGAAEPERPWLWWPATGLWLGLAALSKYQAATVGLGLAVFLLSTPTGRRQLLSPWPYAAGLIILGLASPVLVWNAAHDWISFTFQSGRGAPRRLAPLGPVIDLVAQAALLLPWIAAPLVWATYGAIRKGASAERAWFCLMAAAPTIVLFTVLPLFGAKILPHWPMPGWLLLFPVLGQALAGARGAWPRPWAVASAAVLLVFWALAVSDAATGWVKDAFPRAFPKADPTLEAMEWSRLRGQLADRGLLDRPGLFVAAVKWNEAGKIDQALGGRMPVLVFSPDPREFAFRPASSRFLGHDALIIGGGAGTRGQLAALAPYFASMTPIQGLSVGREGKAETPLTVVFAHDLLRPYPLPAWAKGGG
jgi:hypothetical protein